MEQQPHGGTSDDPVGDGWAGDMELIAFGGRSADRTPLVPAGRDRDWIGDTPGRSAKWCLPLLMANQAGWLIVNPVGVTVTWDGGVGTEALTIVSDEPRLKGHAGVASLFGRGIVSFQPPYLFRTTAMFDLLVRGPANLPKDGVSALEGLVETDWAIMPFTMNWQITRPGLRVRWEAGEPFCQLVPQRRTDLPETQPRRDTMVVAPETAALSRQARQDRRKVRQRDAIIALGYVPTEDMSGLDRQYFRGHYPDGRKAPAHRAQVRLRSFQPLPERSDEHTGPRVQP